MQISNRLLRDSLLAGKTHADEGALVDAFEHANHALFVLGLGVHRLCLGKGHGLLCLSDGILLDSILDFDLVFRGFECIRLGLVVAGNHLFGIHATQLRLLLGLFPGLGCKLTGLEELLSFLQLGGVSVIFSFLLLFFQGPGGILSSFCAEFVDLLLFERGTISCLLFLHLGLELSLLGAS